ncbi:hypothetical protein DDB_G0275977 [Dictyostelium discoideum AX4]|uniref:Uncharacterized protein n=1 Tax=Dictyostelium discoideum TaxID=44689 RepID=Q552L4_DICDI|nr:hypothetical protein DDB_G0275977 [Dictyostelium discoideum AX4]EAL69445.1 hypothetical protein DDB_G0275977 [Dictyostelium discoideum AX4]|eukprot:XP_643368.1 hypothetical protein DDB_G0275977 [Dictyostelium discoideum AX4]
MQSSKLLFGETRSYSSKWLLQYDQVSPNRIDKVLHSNSLGVRDSIGSSSSSSGSTILNKITS